MSNQSTPPKTNLEDALDEILSRIVSQEAITEGGWAEYTTDPEVIKYGNPLHNKEKLKSAITNLFVSQFLEVVGEDIELRGDVDDELLKYVPDMEERSLEVTGVSSSFTNMYTRAIVRSTQQKIRTQIKDTIGRRATKEQE